MSNCDNKIAVSIASNTCDPVTKGVKPLGYICNFEDVDHASMTKTTGKNSFSEFKLKTGAKLYKVYQEGKNPYNGATSEAQVSDYRTTWNKSLPLVIFQNGADVTANIIDKLANGKFVVIVENAFAGTNGDNVFEIFGYETGLMMSEGNNNKYDENYGGGWSVTMQEQNAPTSALYILGTDVATTRAALEAMVTPTTSGSSSSDVA